MALQGRWGYQKPMPCSYLHDETARFEAMLLTEVDETAVSHLIAQGYRHFGNYFFRPYCQSCHACVPIRVRVSEFRKTRSVRKTLSRAGNLSIRVVPPTPSREAFELYKNHKTRFHSTGESGDGNSAEDRTDGASYESFVSSLFHPFPFAYVLEIRNQDRLLAVSHFDMTDTMLSAVYCYYDLDSLRLSLGRLAIYTQMNVAASNNIPYVYLGYYIQANNNMQYKDAYCPNEVLLDNHGWVPFMSADGRRLLPQEQMDAGFQPPGRPLLG